MKKTVVYLFLLTLGMSAFAQEASSVSTSQLGGRYEIIQSPLARRYTFKLDKYTGNVWQYVMSVDDNPTWQSVPRAMDILGTLVPYSITDEEISNTVRYQLYIGGIAARDMFLLEIETGQTWVLTNSSDDVLFFNEIKEPAKDKLEEQVEEPQSKESLMMEDL